jgi:hypothetical protein
MTADPPAARYGSRTSRALALPCTTSPMASLTPASGLPVLGLGPS